MTTQPQSPMDRRDRQALWLIPLAVGVGVVANAVVGLSHQDWILWIVILVGVLLVVLSCCKIRRLGKKD